MPEKRWGRLRRNKDGAAPAEDDTVHISDEHAWWAEREELESQDVPHGRKRRRTVEDKKKSAFEEYFSTESLFDWTGEESNGLFDESDPYVVLGLPPSASWEQITASHRRLAKLHHPDRLVDPTDEQRATSEHRIRELNIAYMELRRRKGR
jgi:DnaJ-domain-containing protein 1